jgi:Tfp pilus assembly protein PilO
VESPVRQPYLGHLVIVGLLLASVAAVRAVYVNPRVREAKSLRAERGRLEADLADLQRGLQEMDVWQRSHPGEDASRYTARRALPSSEMVAAFLNDVTPIANRWGVKTQLIQPAGTPVDVATTDASGRTETYRKAELRFRLIASYRSLGEYLREVEAMDQLVVVRSVTIRTEGPKESELVADVAIWLYGTP